PSMKAFHGLREAIARSITVFDRVLLMNDAVEFGGNRSVVGFVELCLPQQHAWTIAIATDHLFRALIDAFLKYCISDELPSGVRHNCKYAEFVACVHEGMVLRIVAAIRGEAG